MSGSDNKQVFLCGRVSGSGDEVLRFCGKVFLPLLEDSPLVSRWCADVSGVLMEALLILQTVKLRLSAFFNSADSEEKNLLKIN